MMEKCTSQKSTHSCIFEAYSHSCNRKPLRIPEGLMVEVTGLEPAASASRTQRSTKLSHTSKAVLFPNRFNSIAQIDEKVKPQN